MPFETSYRESRTVQLAFALLLRDQYSRTEELVGDVAVKAGNVEAVRKPGSSGSFVFLSLTPGPYTLDVACGKWTPFYRPISIPVSVPALPAAWPAYPDITLANRTLPLDDSGQPPAFRNQFALASLLPTTQYPFDNGATLVRGTVTHAGATLADATVSRAGGDEVPYVTGPNGEFVLFFEKSTGVPQPLTIRVTHAGLPDKDQNVTIVRGTTVITNIDV